MGCPTRHCIERAYRAKACRIWRDYVQSFAQANGYRIRRHKDLFIDNLLKLLDLPLNAIVHVLDCMLSSWVADDADLVCARCRRNKGLSYGLAGAVGLQVEPELALTVLENKAAFGFLQARRKYAEPERAPTNAASHRHRLALAEVIRMADRPLCTFQ